MRLLRIAAACLCCSLAPAAPARAAADFDALVGEFVDASLALSPVTATAQGYHRHRGALLDEELDDFSPSGVGRALRFYRDWEWRLDRLDTAGLDAEQRVDLQIIRNAVDLALLNLQTTQAWRHDPTVYAELIGHALLDPIRLDYAPAGERFGQAVKRLQKIPRLLEQARANLADAAPVAIQAARDRNAGNFRLIDQVLRGQVPAAQKAAYAAAAAQALDALRDFNRFLEQTLSQRQRPWRLGAAAYREKCGRELDVGRTPEEMIAGAQDDLQAARSEMRRLAAPRSVRQALDRVARGHATQARYLAQARQSLQQATDFVRTSGLVPLPAQDTPRLAETPDLMRAAYPVGGFDPAPALQPQLGAFYWVTPIPADWPADRIEARLSEYNDFGIQQLTIREAMPGHWVQAEYASRIRPAPRRALRALYGNRPYVEGWAVYAQQLMVDQGYLEGEWPLRLTLLQQVERAAADTILDVGLHAEGMSDQQALELMSRDALPDPREAASRLQRAKQSSCRLAASYAGLKGWMQIRDRFRQQHPADYSVSGFNERALSEGAVPLPALGQLLLP